MSILLYDASVQVFLRGFTSLSVILEKAAAHATTANVDPSDLISARLAPDMYTLAGQVQTASDAAKSCAARLSGRENPSFPDVETTFPELQARIAATVAFLKSIEAGEINDAPVREIRMTVRGEQVVLDSQTYLLTLSLPNFFFHVATAYDILRHRGVDLSKRDYLGNR